LAKIQIGGKTMVGSHDFLMYGYARGEFLSPDLLFNASFNFSKYSVLLQLIHFMLTLHFDENILQHSLHLFPF